MRSLGPLFESAAAARLEDATFVQPVLDTPTKEIRGMVRGDSPIESQAAAVRILPHLHAIQSDVLRVVLLHAPDGMTAKELEQHVLLEKYGFSTVRVRCTELKRAGVLAQRGTERRDGCAVLYPVPTSPHVIHMLSTLHGGG